jgi:hypothetical protein
MRARQFLYYTSWQFFFLGRRRNWLHFCLLALLMRAQTNRLCAMAFNASPVCLRMCISLAAADAKRGALNHFISQAPHCSRHFSPR